MRTCNHSLTSSSPPNAYGAKDSLGSIGFFALNPLGQVPFLVSQSLPLFLKGIENEKT